MIEELRTLPKKAITRKINGSPRVKEELSKVFYWAKTSSEIAFCVANNITEPVLCGLDGCENAVKFISSNGKSYYSNGCCPNHSREISMVLNHGVSHPSYSPDILEVKKRNNLLKYGMTNPIHLPEIQHRIRSDYLDKYGVDHPAKTPEFHRKRKLTCIEKYGVDHPAKSEEVKQKVRNTTVSRYGVSNAMKNESVKRNIRERYAEKYGVSNPSQNPDVREKIERTNKMKYGVGCVFKCPNIIDRIKRIMRERYGVDHHSQKHISSHNLNNLNDVEYITSSYNTLGARLSSIDLGVSVTTMYNYLEKHSVDRNKFKNRSTHENTITELFRSNGYSNIIINDKTILPSGKELDIYLPDHDLAIEVNGLYWHSDIDKNYHQAKKLEAMENGIDLIMLTDYEIDNKWDIVRSMLLTRINVYEKRYFARNLQIAPADSTLAQEFIDENHIAGYTHAKINMALVNERGICAMGTFSQSRFDKKYDWELIRYCVAKNTHIVGGMAKIISNFSRLYPGSIISYVDLDHFSGKSFESNGWNNVGMTPPGYFWTDGNKIISRGKAMKKNMHRLLVDKFDPLKTEVQNMTEAGYRQYWNCGNLKMIKP